eukprot:12899228-Prorocentrum_lima.AAC.1
MRNTRTLSDLHHHSFATQVSKHWPCSASAAIVVLMTPDTPGMQQTASTPMFNLKNGHVQVELLVVIEIM